MQRRRQDMTGTVYSVAMVWRSVLLAFYSSSVILFAEEWSRQLSHIKSFLSIRSVYQQLLSQASIEDTAVYSVSGNSKYWITPPSFIQNNILEEQLQSVAVSSATKSHKIF